MIGDEVQRCTENMRREIEACTPEMMERNGLPCGNPNCMKIPCVLAREVIRLRKEAVRRSPVGKEPRREDPQGSRSPHEDANIALSDGQIKSVRALLLLLAWAAMTVTLLCVAKVYGLI